MDVTQLKAQIETSPQTVQFSDVIEVIDAHFEFTPTHFINGDTVNEANQNNGSCKIFAFAKLQGFNESETLACFGDFYRNDVLQHPENQDHQNIRNFIKYGWNGITFSGTALTLK
ncbi:HopJ type III effector protein [Vibrio sp.]|uniref:Type III effector n=1 Tax=Vibrio viridaestus TaxID=2487322 RepID=A0A3N9TMI6_9VIBR|nr:HopJ type III effector protein [Vibrio viridaestus]MDC0611862.1 HopJ type III effector protein [Vibrio sp.]RQW64855.1 type III effector [Vibrio viridaestus]